MLAARARGLGTSLTTLTWLRPQEVAEILRLPDSVKHCALVPTAYYTGDAFSPAKRLPVEQVTFLNQWDTPLDQR
jgi:hypothetical protein